MVILQVGNGRLDPVCSLRMLFAKIKKPVEHSPTGFSWPDTKSPTALNLLSLRLTSGRGPQLLKIML